MKEYSEKKCRQLAEYLNINLEDLTSYLRKNKLYAKDIIKLFENSNFNKDIIPHIFNYDHTNNFNPFIYLLMEMKDAIVNMNDNLAYLENYNLKSDLFRFYFGIANLVNSDCDISKKECAKLLKNFDKNLAHFIKKTKEGQIEDIKGFVRQLTNLLKINRNGVEYTTDRYSYNYIKEIVDIGYMQIFLKVANADEKTFKSLYHLKLQLPSNCYGDDITFMEELELYDKIALDEMMKLIMEDFDTHKDNVYDLLTALISRVENKVYIEFYEGLNQNQAIANNKGNIEKDKDKEKEKNKIKISYLNLEKLLKEKIIGQDEIIEKLVERIKVANFGVSKEVGAKAIFLLAGPTGVGKTEVVKLISQYINENDNNKENKLVRIDMSEYKEGHSVSKIIGAPPGYVGYNNWGDNNVFDKVRKNPNAIILLDEIEKAHPQVLDVFLHIFDEGKAKTNKQEEVDFRNTIFFMTTNIGAFEVKRNVIGFDNNKNENEEKRKIYKKSLENYLRPEFINRIDEILIFNSLTKENIILIINNQIRNLERQMKEKKQIEIRINITAEALEYLINKIDYNQYDAREVRRMIEKYILGPIIDISSNLDLNNKILNINCFQNKLDYSLENEKVLKKEM